MMRKKNRIMAGCLAAILFFAVWGLSSHQQVLAKDPIKIRYTTGMPPTHYFCSDVQTHFAKEVEKRSQGKVKVELYSGGQLFGFVDSIDAARTGAVEMALTSCGHWGGYNPIFKFSDYFLLVDNYEHWLRARNAIHPILQALYEKHNVKLLSYSAYGGNSIFGKKPISRLDDLKGQKIRAPVPGAFPCISAWGATPAKVDPGEVYDALSKGAIDAAITSWGFGYATKIFDVTKFYVGPIWWTMWVNFMNLDTWNSLPKDIQQIVMDVSKESEDRSLESMTKFEDTSLAKLREVGTVKILSSEELKEWGKPLKVVYGGWVEECDKAKYGKEARAIIEALDKVR